MDQHDNISIVSESFAVDDSSVVPIWLQIRNRILYLITSGKLKKGDQLPSIRQLAIEQEVNLNTVSKVYQDLRRDGFVSSHRGKGLFVADISNANMDAVDNANRSFAEEFISRCYMSGMSPDDVLELVRTTMDTMNER